MEHSQNVSEKDKSKHMFSSFDVLTVVISGILVIGVTLNIIYKNNEQNKIQMAKNSAKNYAEDLIKNPVNSSGNKDRVPASDSENNMYSGKLGKDPWGQSYNYKVIQNSYGQPIYMAVISTGPDKHLDTDLNQPVPRDSAQLHIRGDDVGYLKSFR